MYNAIISIVRLCKQRDGLFPYESEGQQGEKSRGSLFFTVIYRLVLRLFYYPLYISRVAGDEFLHVILNKFPKNNY